MTLDLCLLRHIITQTDYPNELHLQDLSGIKCKTYLICHELKVEARGSREAAELTFVCTEMSKIATSDAEEATGEAIIDSYSLEINVYNTP